MTQRLRFHRKHLAAVEAGTKRVTMRFRDPVEVGPALLVFEFPQAVVRSGRIISTQSITVAAVTDEQAREDGFRDAAAVLPGLREYYPDLQPDDHIVIVRFDVG